MKISKIYNITCIENQFNFGQRLQAYALQKYIKTKFNIDVYTIDLRKTSSDFTEFEQKHMNLLKIDSFSKLNFLDSDIVLVGGDQVITGAYIGRHYYLGDFAKSKAKLISYSASANGLLANKSIIQRLQKTIELLKNFKYLSFREKIDSIAMKQQNTSSKIDFNIDPVFLLSIDEWKQIMKKPFFINNDDVFDFEYIISQKQQKNILQQLPDGSKKITLCANVVNSSDFEVKDPGEFLWLIEHSREFKTTSYHGNMFGIMFKKQMTFPSNRTYTIINSYQGTVRLDSFLDLVEAETSTGKITNYDTVNKNIELQKQKSYEWLKEALSYKDFKYTCYSKDNNIRSKSSSGGISAILAKHIIENNGVVYGAAYSDDFKSVKTIKVSTLEDYFNKISKSKYNFCQMPDIENVKQDLEFGKQVLFTGCPCQIKKLKTELNKQYENLVTVDLLCNGYSRPEILKNFVESQEKEENSKIIFMDMRHKSNISLFNLKLKFANGKEKILQNIVTNTFVCNKSNYITDCLTCDMHIAGNSLADLTIGDFWSYGKYRNICNQQFDPKNGTSVVYINTEIGRKIFNMIKSDIEWVYLI